MAELAERLTQSAAPALCDANTDTTRSRYGIISGARRLSRDRDYDPGAELPADESHALLFYGHSEMCGAAASAARKAVAAGYERV
ncbi:MAG: hypothetical protein JSU66_15415 [Deltaproteobacteria bacterium]|nr:MAG: hypothetical protein JSU66_15415 [Deltaproteobacteria bacterium]